MAERVVVDPAVGLVAAVRPGGDLLGEPARGVVDHEVDRLLDDVDAVAGDDLAEAGRAELRGADLGPQVADVVGQPVVHLQRVEHVAALDALVDDLHDRPAHAFAPDVGSGDVVAAGHGAARVAVVALDRRDEHHASRARARVVGEHRAEHVVVGEVAAAVVRIVGDEHVALAELVDTEELEREPDGQRGGEHELWDAHAQRGQPSASVEHGGVALVATGSGWAWSRCG